MTLYDPLLLLSRFFVFCTSPPYISCTRQKNPIRIEHADRIGLSMQRRVSSEQIVGSVSSLTGHSWDQRTGTEMGHQSLRPTSGLRLFSYFQVELL